MFSKDIYHKKFIDNKYLNWYFSIITNIINENRKKQNDVYENHHILPKSIFPEYAKDKNNLILLTPREHFVCHKLLVKFTVGRDKRNMQAAIAAFNMNNPNQQRFFTSRQYNEIRENYIISSLGENNNFYGKKHTQETKYKISQKNKGKLTGKNNPCYGRTGENNPCYGRTGENHPMFNKSHTEETKNKMREWHRLNGHTINRPKNSGDKNPNFKGYWVTPFGILQTAKQIPDILPESCVVNWCRNKNSNIITEKYFKSSPSLNKLYDETIIGKTFKDLGYDYIPKTEC